MSIEPKVPGMFILAVAAMLLLAAIAIPIVHQANLSRSRLPVWGDLPDFEFTNALTGEPYGLADMKGQVTVVDFIFTRCPGACPIMSGHFEEMYRLYGGSQKVQLVSISVDPEYDTPEMLTEYAESRGVIDNRWVFLRAPIEDVIDLCENGFMLAAENLPGGHTTKFTLVDQTGAIRAYCEGLQSESVNGFKTHVRTLARELP